MTSKTNDMNKTMKIVTLFLLTASLVACGGSGKDDKGKLTDMKTELSKLEKEKNDLDAKIHKLEDDIAKADPDASQVAKLISIEPVRSGDFNHYIELQGKIDAENVVMAAPSGQGGVVKAVYVKTGSKVSKGQLLLRLDNAVQQQGVALAQQQIGGIRAQLAQAQSIYERQQNLWKQNIGTEIQVLNAKTNVEALQSQLRAAEANVGLQQQTANLSNVYAEISGVVDAVDIKVGEFFSPQTAATHGIRIVNNGSLRVITKVPDVYVGKINQGDSVQVVVPESGKPYYNSRVSVVGTFIDPQTRSFNVEAKLPVDPLLRSNQTATMKVLDYSKKGTITVPVNVVQSDEKGKYVYVAEKVNNKLTARRKTVIAGEAYGGQMEIKSGLSGGEQIITEGYQTVYDGQAVKTGN